MSDTEKITLNLGVVDLGQVDLLVEQGFYSSRTDFIRTAIRNQLVAHADQLKQTVARKSSVLGVVGFSRHDLEQVRAEGKQLEISAVGLLVLADDISPELALATIKSLNVYGVLRASEAVKAALQKRQP